MTIAKCLPIYNKRDDSCLELPHDVIRIWKCFPHYWAPSQYPKRRFFVRSPKVSKPRDWYLKLSYRFEIWQAHRQHCCRSACQISEWSDNSKYKSRDFKTLQDLTERRLFRYWDGAMVLCEGNPPVTRSLTAIMVDKLLHLPHISYEELSKPMMTSCHFDLWEQNAMKLIKIHMFLKIVYAKCLPFCPGAHLLMLTNWCLEDPPERILRQDFLPICLPGMLPHNVEVYYDLSAIWCAWRSRNE